MEFSLHLERTAYTLEQLITDGVAQIALAGRSNVGKSSLINALAGTIKIAKTSATPGKTRSVNFYRVNPYSFFLVDLPGYGYARASHLERRDWANLLDVYFAKCVSLKALAILLDGRLTPQKNDLDMIAYAKHLGVRILPILTKADKVTQREVVVRVKEWTNIIGNIPVVTSSIKKRGIKEICHQFIAVATAKTILGGGNQATL